MQSEAALEPWQSYPGIWKSPSAFFTYLRGSLRQIWSRYPAKLAWKQSLLTEQRPEGYLGRGKKFGKCHYCQGWFTASALEVDHVSQAGSCNTWEQAYQFLHNLLDTNDNWVLACKPCHKAKSLAERKGIDFYEALLERQANELLKGDKQKLLDIFAKFGYTTQQTSNSRKRKQALLEILSSNEMQTLV